MKKILSVSVASYNVEKYLDNLFDVLTISKTVNDKIELIIVNDGSKDNTLLVSKKYQNQYPNSIIIVDKQNGGYGSTINHAIKKASGKYFKVLDADDWFEKSNIEDFLAFLEYRNEDVIISPYVKVFEETGKKELVDRLKKINYENPLHMHEICVRTDLYKNKCSEITEHCFYTDSEYAMNVMSVCDSIVRYDKPIYCYRIGREGQSVSNEGRIKHIKDSETVAVKLVTEYKIQGKKFFNAMKEQIVTSIVFHYKSLALLPPEEAIIKIYEFDTRLKSLNKEEYLWVEQNYRTIRLLRLIRFHSSYFVVKLLRRN